MQTPNPTTLTMVQAPATTRPGNVRVERKSGNPLTTHVIWAVVMLMIWLIFATPLSLVASIPGLFFIIKVAGK